MTRIVSLQPSDTKLAESVHPNPMRATAGGEREEERMEDFHADAQTGGPWGNVLSMFL